MKLPGFSSEVGYLQRMIALTAVVGLLWFLWGRGSPLAESQRDTAPPQRDTAPPQRDTAPPQRENAPPQRDTAPPQRENAPPDSAPVRPRPWLASTSPAITDTLVELGLAGHLVGRSPYCRSVPATLPVVGDLRDFDAERLAIAAPDVLFVQPPLAGVDPALATFCTGRGIRLVERRIDSFADVARLVAAIAEAIDLATTPGEDVVAPRVERATSELELIGRKASDPARAERPKALVLVASEPFLAVGRANYLDELLAAADLDNALDRDGWIETSPETILALEADAILGIAQSEVGAERLRAALAALPWPAGRAPPTGVRAVPELLSPSLVALRRRDVIAALAAEAMASEAAR